MALDIQQREREGITILDLKGRITVGDEAGALGQHETLQKVAGIGDRRHREARRR